jgi:signal transduction histidine kinase
MWFSISAYSIKPGTFVAVFDVITARKGLEQSLKQAIQSRDEFFSIASHELRTPLAALIMQVDLIRKFLGSGDSIQIKKAEDLCLSSNLALKTLDLLLSDLMDLGRIRAGRFSMEPETVDLRTLIEEVIHSYSALLAASGSTLTFVPEKPVVGNWDPARIREVLTNLISNAIKYGEGKPIQIWQGFDAIRQSAIVRVADQGMGVSPEVRGRLFERFERGAPGQRIGGLGLGLFIARQIVEAHRGEITYDPGPQGGSIFTVRLPLNST